MKNLFIALLIVITFSCKKSEPKALPFEEQLAIDQQKIDTYLAKNKVTNILNDCLTGDNKQPPNCNGKVKYVLHTKGNGLTPPNRINTQMTVSYTGWLLETGKEFDTRNSASIVLGNVIKGWQVILVKMQEGDSVTIYIPSGYGYGFAGKGEKIPSNANLIFKIKLEQVK